MVLRQIVYLTNRIKSVTYKCMPKKPTAIFIYLGQDVLRKDKCQGAKTHPQLLSSNGFAHLYFNLNLQLFSYWFGSLRFVSAKIMQLI